MKIGILHPGQMGISVAASAKNSGCEVYWVSEDRSLDSSARAESQSLIDVGNLEQLIRICPVIVSVCPPHAAESLAAEVIGTGFNGLYIDANAISPKRALRIAELVEINGGRYVDGGIIGGPAWESGRTWMYLSGTSAHEASECFSGGPLEVEVIGDLPGKASALKMCFAAYTKGSTALISAIVAAASGLGVWEELERQWSKNGSEFAEQAVNRVRRVTAKSWRFAGEMEEIAATLSSAGLPPGFHEAAGEVYRRSAHFKGWIENPPELEEVVNALLVKKD